MAERALLMVCHSVLIAIILFIFMLFVLKQSQTVAENRSVLLGAIALIYMVLFGHGLPKTINKDIF